ncbi:MAG: hypothetical protein J2P22_04020 [Nocardioides sp.]|nr:hypothetical protein [Nocardioides sp.]
MRQRRSPEELHLFHLRADIGRAVRDGKHDVEVELRREYREAKLASVIRAAVDQAPPLTDEQRNRLAALLRPTTTTVDGGPA